MIHISNNFISSTVHASVISELSETFEDQLVIVPIRERAHEGMNTEGLVNIRFRFIYFNNKIIKFFPLLKVLLLSLRVHSLLSAAGKACGGRGKKLNVIAHNFWSDGTLAFFNSFFIPMRYMLVVRNTDINYFIARLPHYRWLMAWAIRRSEGLTFVSRSHYLRFKAQWPSLLAHASKVEIIPNALSNRWLDNIVENPIARPAQVCFVGRFDANKNLVNLLNAAQIVRAAMPDFGLVLVGGDESELRATTGYACIPDFVEVRGRLQSEELLDVYRCSRVFVMPSFTETFGLVYLEALSQGCSVICSIGEGIDGMWEVPFIRAVDPKGVDALASDMMDLINRFPEGIPVSWSVPEIRRFDWKRVADKYLEFFS